MASSPEPACAGPAGAPAPVTRVVAAARDGVVTRVDAGAIGQQVLLLGGGRTRPGDRVDHAVGVSGLAEVGDIVVDGQALGRIHARTECAAAEAAVALGEAISIGAPS